MAKTYKPYKSKKLAARLRAILKNPFKGSLFAMPGTAPKKGQTATAWRTRRKTKRKLYK